LPEDFGQLVFLCGIVCLFLAPHLRWGPRFTPTKSVLAQVFAVCALYAVHFAATSGFYVCFRPGSHPARRILGFVLVPAIMGEFVSAIYVLFPDALSFSVSPHDFDFFSSLSKLGLGFHYGVAGLACVAVFTARLALNSASLPLSLPKASVLAGDDPTSWNRVEGFLWVLLALMPLVLWIWFPIVMNVVVYELIFAHFPAVKNLDMALFAVKNFATDVVIAGVAVWMIGKDAWGALRRSLHWPGPGEFALATAFPVGVASLISISEFLFDMFGRAVHRSGGLGLPHIQSYFTLPTAGTFWFLLVAFPEEVIFRGLLQPRFVRRYGPLRGIFLLGIAFAGAHFSTDFSIGHTDRLNGWLVILMMCLRLISGVGMSFVTGWLTLRTGSVLPAAVAHGLFDVLVYSPLGPGFQRIGPVLLVILWAALAYVLFRYWPVQAEAVQQSSAAFAGNMTRPVGQPSEQLTPTNHERGLHSRMLGVLRRPLLGPVLFGLVYGGIPCGIIFGLLGSDVYTVVFLRFTIGLTPLAVVVSTLSPTLSVNRTWQHILLRVSLTSFATCVPVPAIVCTELARRWGEWVVKDIPRMIAFFGLWAVAVTIPSWLLAFGYAHMKNRRSRRVAQT
jgi:membrane protease YdiL (CAAX protease family)